MNIAKSVNIARLVTAYNLQIDSAMLPDNLKCVKCKLVLQDACQVPCGCRFCRACIDEMMASGSEFCPGVSEDCGESLLSGFVTDYSRNKRISKLPVKCPRDGCVFECRLGEIEDHMRVCGKKSATCPFYTWGCQQDKLGAEEMSGHFQEENRSHCEILIGMIADITREVKMLKRSDESRKMEIEMMKHERGMKEGQIILLIDQIQHVENEIKTVKREKADLANLVRILSEKLDREIDERRESDERDMANVIEQVDREITAITGMIGSNKDELDTTIISVRDDIRSNNQDSIKSIKCDIDCIQSQLKSIQEHVTAGQIDASCEWTIDADLGKTTWDWSLRDTDSINTGISQDYFTGAVLPYKYRLASSNIIGIYDQVLRIYLRIYPGPCDSQLPWPFSGRVTITVADRNTREACQTITLKCEIRNPVNNFYRNSVAFKLLHSSLITAGLKIDHGVRVSCAIVPSSLGR